MDQAISAAVDPCSLQELLASDPPFWRYLLNSTIVSGLTTVITLAMAIPAAYGLARIPLQLRRVLRWITAAAALFPYVLLFLALLELARRFSLGNSLIALAMPYSGLAMPLALLLLTSAFEALPGNWRMRPDWRARIVAAPQWVLVPLLAPASATRRFWCFCSPGMNTPSP